MSYVVHWSRGLAAGIVLVATPLASVAGVTFTSAERITEASIDQRSVSNALGLYSAARDDVFDLGQNGFAFVEATQDSEIVDLANQGDSIFARGVAIGNLLPDGESLFNDAFSFLTASFTVTSPTVFAIGYEVLGDPVEGGMTNARITIAGGADGTGPVFFDELAEGAAGIGGTSVGTEEVTLTPGEYRVTMVAGVLYDFDDQFVAPELSTRAEFVATVTIVPAPGAVGVLAVGAAGLSCRRRR